MQCRSCGTPILATFKHAIAQNICPACGGQIMDEESLALIEDVGNTIRNEAAVRGETAHNLAVALVARYDITLRNNEQMSQMPVQRVPAQSTSPQSTAQQPVTQHKVAPPSAMKQAMTQDVMSAPEMPDGISERERERMLEEAVRSRYNMVDQIQADTMTNEDFADEQALVPAEESVFSEGTPNPILERERLARLAKQQQAMNGGGQGVFRRGS